LAEATAPAAATAALLAKGALRRLAQAKLEPTPANFARAYAEEAGQPPPTAEGMSPKLKPLVERLVSRASEDPVRRTELVAALMDGRHDDLQRALDDGADDAAQHAQAWAALIERLARALERGSRNWTPGRKKESLQRVLDGSRSDSQRLQQRLRQLVASWEDGAQAAGVEVGAAPEPIISAAMQATAPPADEAAATGEAQRQVVDAMGRALLAGLPADEPRAADLADELGALAQRIHAEGATGELAARVAEACHRAERLFAHRHHLVDELLRLCRSLTEGLGELAEDGSWARGQSQSLRARLDDASSARAVRAAHELLTHTRKEQQQLRTARDTARDALKAMMQHMLAELAELGSVTGRFNENIAGYADVIERADTLDGLAGVVREMVGETRAVHDLVAGARDRLAAEHARAGELESRVRELEGELRRLSDEVSTDALTQVANRRGMASAFEAERARVERGAAPMAIGLIDIDNFKRLNDSLGHAVGDVALKSLAARVKDWLRPVDHVARYGGEEFVVLLPATPVDEAQQVLTRLQRQLSASLFMHEGREVFITFSAGVTLHRAGEALDTALERADEALYEAKRTGKNKTCVA